MSWKRISSVPIGVAILVLALFAASATASPITQTQAFTLSGSFFIPPGTDSPTYTFDQFDDLGGTRFLTSVSIRFFNTELTESVSTTNASLDSADVTLSVTGTVRAYVPTAAIPLASTINPADLTVTPVAGIDTAFDVAAGSTTDLGPLTGTFDGLITLTDPSDLAVYTGSGTVDILVRSSMVGEVVSTATFNPSESPIDYGTGDFQLIYEWTEIPEPATAGLLALGALTLIARRRRQLT
jgi:hypothetical protein